MKLSSSTNAHGELYSQENYGYALCCTGLSSKTHDCENGNTILKLSSTTNAHAEIPYFSNYPKLVCYGNLKCGVYYYSCENPEYPLGLLSLSSESNAHLGGFNDYTTKICCNYTTSINPVCGNSVLEGSEKCDCGYDGICNSVELGGNTCTTVKGSYWYGTLGCTAPPTGCQFDTSKCYYCGNSVKEGAEQCDDGNHNSNDGCSSTCKTEYCGDGVTQTALGEECDYGVDNGKGLGCSATCKTEYCGDGVPQEGRGELCDDGNTNSGDGCCSTCAVEFDCTCRPWTTLNCWSQICFLYQIPGYSQNPASN